MQRRNIHHLWNKTRSLIKVVYALCVFIVIPHRCYTNLYGKMSRKIKKFSSRGSNIHTRVLSCIYIALGTIKYEIPSKNSFGKTRVGTFDGSLVVTTVCYYSYLGTSSYFTS